MLNRSGENNLYCSITATLQSFINDSAFFKNATFTTYILPIPTHKVPKECQFNALSFGVTHIAIS